MPLGKRHCVNTVNIVLNNSEFIKLRKKLGNSIENQVSFFGGGFISECRTKKTKTLEIIKEHFAEESSDWLQKELSINTSININTSTEINRVLNTIIQIEVLIEYVLTLLAKGQKFDEVSLWLGEIDSELEHIVALQLISGLHGFAEISKLGNQKTTDERVASLAKNQKTRIYSVIATDTQPNCSTGHSKTLISLSGIRNVNSWIEFLMDSGAISDEFVDFIYFDKPYEEIRLLSKRASPELNEFKSYAEEITDIRNFKFDPFNSESERLNFLIKTANDVLKAKFSTLRQELKRSLNPEKYNTLILSDVPSISNVTLLDAFRSKSAQVIYLPHSFGSAAYQMPEIYNSINWTNISSKDLLDHNYQHKNINLRNERVISKSNLMEFGSTDPKLRFKTTIKYLINFINNSIVNIRVSITKIRQFLSRLKYPIVIGCFLETEAFEYLALSDLEQKYVAMKQFGDFVSKKFQRRVIVLVKKKPMHGSNKILKSLAYRFSDDLVTINLVDCEIKNFAKNIQFAMFNRFSTPCLEVVRFNCPVVQSEIGNENSDYFANEWRTPEIFCTVIDNIGNDLRQLKSVLKQIQESQKQWFVSQESRTRSYEKFVQ